MTPNLAALLHPISCSAFTCPSPYRFVSRPRFIRLCGDETVAELRCASEKGRDVHDSLAPVTTGRYLTPPAAMRLAGFQADGCWPSGRRTGRVQKTTLSLRTAHTGRGIQDYHVGPSSLLDRVPHGARPDKSRRICDGEHVAHAVMLARSRSRVSNGTAPSRGVPSAGSQWVDAGKERARWRPVETSSRSSQDL
jgi:hypothetical protein